MALSIVQAKSSADLANSVTLVTGLTKGNWLLVTANDYGHSTLTVPASPTVSGSVPGSYKTLASGTSALTSTAVSYASWLIPVTSALAGATAIAFNSGTADGHIKCWAVEINSSNNYPLFVDQSTSGTGTGGTPSVGPITTTQTNSLAFFCFPVNGANPSVTTGGWTIVGGQNFSAFGYQSVANSSTAVSVTGTLSASNTWAISLFNIYEVTPYAAYALNEGSGTTIKDYSGNNRNMTVLGSNTWTSGHGPYAKSFQSGTTGSDGAYWNNGATIPALAGDVTVMMWHLTTAGTSTISFAGGLYGSPGFARTGIFSYRSLSGNASAPQITARDSTGATVYSYGNNGTTADTNWHHTTVVWHAAGNFDLYIDGVLFGTQSTSGNPIGNLVQYLGVGSSLSNTGAQSQVQDMRVFANALTAADVTAMMNTSVAPGIIRGPSVSNASGAQQTTPLTLTVPSTTPVGSVCWLMTTADLGSSGTPTMTVTSTGTTPLFLGTANYNTTGDTSNLYWFVSTAADQGATISMTPSGNCYLGMSLATYTGASVTQPDVFNSSVQSTAATTFVGPTEYTGFANDWTVSFASFLAGGNITGFPGTLVTQDSASRTAIVDSNGSVGAIGTLIGGGTWTGNASAQWIGFTVGMIPASTTSTLFGQQTSPVGSGGGGGATTGTYGLQFSVTSTSILQGIWFYSPAASTVIPDSIGIYDLTTGLIQWQTAAWNGAIASGWIFAKFTAPVFLVPGVLYKAAIRVPFASGNWNITTASYWSTGLGGNGIAIGTLTAPSDASAGNFQNSYVSGTGIQYPNTSQSAANIWMDVQVTAAPTGTYTAFKQVSNTITATNDNSAYTFGMQYSVSSAHYLNAVWFYSPFGSGEAPEAIGVYDVNSQALIHQEVPTWSYSSGGGWIRAKFLTPPLLNASQNYKVVILKSGGTNNWYAAYSHYWDTTGPGASGLTNGPMTIPNNASALNGQTGGGGQDVFNAGTGISYPNNSFNAGNYWVDAEITAAPSGGGGAITINGVVVNIPVSPVAGLVLESILGPAINVSIAGPTGLVNASMVGTTGSVGVVAPSSPVLETISGSTSHITVGSVPGIIDLLLGGTTGLVSVVGIPGTPSHSALINGAVVNIGVASIPGIVIVGSSQPVARWLGQLVRNDFTGGVVGNGFFGNIFGE